MKRLLGPVVCLFLSAASLQAQSRPASLLQATSPSHDALGSASTDADGYLYVSGQGPRRPDGTLPTKFAEQVRQSLENVRKLVEASGLTMDHVVYVQVYLEDTNHYPELNEVFANYFPKEPPARAVLGVARLPEPAVQITAVAVRDLKEKRPVPPPNFAPGNAYSPGMLTHDRLFISTMPGSDPANGTVPSDPAAQVNLALDRMKSVVQAAGLTLAHMVFVNPYLTRDLPMHVMNVEYAKRFEFGNTPGRATIQVSSLPEGAHIAYTGVAVRDLSKRQSIRPKNMPPSPTASPCVFAGDTLYCSAKGGFIPGPNEGIFAATTVDQTRQTMRNLLDNLEEAGMNFDDVVYTTIYLDDLSDTSVFGRMYKKYFNKALPTETLLQQLKPGGRKANEDGEYPELEQVSLIAVRRR
jgi:reactive intermediate/imine deaminase